MACSIVEIPIRYCVPEEGGREQVFFRDIEMVAAADVVICVFDEARPMEGGTGHVVEKAQDRTVPVYAYAYVTETGRLSRIGEWDPDNAWGDRVPRN